LLARERPNADDDDYYDEIRGGLSITEEVGGKLMRERGDFLVELRELIETAMRVGAGGNEGGGEKSRDEKLATWGVRMSKRRLTYISLVKASQGLN
jgi:hypothetical protein